MTTSKNAAELVKALQNTPSRLEKEKLIEMAWANSERIFFMGILLAYDKLITFGVKKVIEIQGENPADFVSTFTFEQFDLLTNKLRERKLTGNADSIARAPLQPVRPRHPERSRYRVIVIVLSVPLHTHNLVTFNRFDPSVRQTRRTAHQQAYGRLRAF